MLDDEDWRPAGVQVGEAVPEQLWNLLRASDIDAINGYGPTECTVDAAMARVDDGLLADNRNADREHARLCA